MRTAALAFVSLASLASFRRVAAHKRPNASMAWHCSSATNDGLISNLEAAGMVSDPRVVSAMRAVDRGDFIATAPYEDSPQLIGHGVTISAPHMHASCLEMLVDYCRPNSVALDIGCGSGIFTVLMSAVAGHRATVIGIDHVSHLVDLSRTNVEKHHADHLRSNAIQYFTADGRKGYPPYAPYDCIHVGAAVALENLDTIQRQLKVGGRLVAPVEYSKYDQRLVVVDRKGEDEFVTDKLMSVGYVPLTSLEKQVGKVGVDSA